MKFPRSVEKLIDRLENNGYEAYVVGGGLRDIMLGREPSDFDVATSALPEQTLSLFSDMKTIPTGLKHGTVTVICDHMPIEVTTFRIDGEYSDSRHPESVIFTSHIEEDLSRRDFTVNAMAYNKTRGFVDPFGGVDDLRKGILRAVRDPELRMKEDALRIMRAFRFSAQLGFSIEENTKHALSSMRKGLANVSGERMGVEFYKLLTSPYPKEPLELMCSLGVSEYVLGDYLPSKELISRLPLLSNGFSARFACLLWECENEKIPPLLAALKYSNEQKRAILTASGAKNCESAKNDVDIRRFLLRFGNQADTAAELREKLCGDTSVCQSELERVRASGFCGGISELSIDGADLIRLGFGGKEIGEKLGELLELVTVSPELNTKDALTEYILKRK